VTSLASTYDPLDRLATQSDGTRSYTYDANGNVTGQQVFSGSTVVLQAAATYDGATAC